MPADLTPPGAETPDFPAPQFPTVFADGVVSLVNSATVVKFFLGRIEPSFAGDGRSQTQAFAQVIMPIDGFTMMFAFFEAQLKSMIQNGIVTEDKLREMRKIFIKEQQ